MLKEEQVAELLRRYKGVLHNHLKMIKDNLRRTENRAAQVWELIVLDAVARIEQVKYESHSGASPGIMLNGRAIRIEPAYIYPNRLGDSLEIPKIVDEHVVYQVLKKKAKQHNTDESRIVCIGSDINGILFNVPALHGAIQTAFEEYPSLSAAIIVKIESEPSFGIPTIVRTAKAEFFPNPSARNPISSKERIFDEIRFDHWTYAWPLLKKEVPGSPADYRMNGELTFRNGKFGEIIEVPTRIVIDSLLGNTSLIKEYGNIDGDLKILNGVVVKSCSFKEADLEAGKPAKIVLEFVPSDSLFYPPK